MGYPSLDQLRAWLQVPAVLVDDAQLQEILDAEIVNQARVCRVPVDITDPLLPVVAPAPDHVRAIYRRVGRELASKGVPLGVIGADSEFGPTRLASFDPEIERLEGPTRAVVFG